MLLEELAIWVVVGVAILIVAILIWRGDGTPRIESNQFDVERERLDLH